MTTSTLATIATAGHGSVLLTRESRRPELLGVSIADQFGPTATVWLDEAARVALVAALTGSRQAEAR